MSEVLSQREIDKLIKKIANNDKIEIVSENKQKSSNIKEYNFARPPKFNKEQLRSLEMIFDNYARIVSSFLTAYLRTSTEIEIMGAEQLTYKEFTTSLSNPIILAIFEMPPFKGSVLLEISAFLGYSIIDRILGGPGIGVTELRDFSEIEKILLKRVVTQMLSFLVEPWENVADVKPSLEKIETNSQFAQIISPNEMVALVSMKIRIGGVEGVMSFCMPHIVLEPYEDRLNTRFWFTNSKAEAHTDYKDLIGGRIENADVTLNAVLGKTNIMIDDFINLQVGDVIPLNSYVNSDIEIYVGDILKFYGKPGMYRNKNSIQITSLARKDEL